MVFDQVRARVLYARSATAAAAATCLHGGRVLDRISALLQLRNFLRRQRRWYGKSESREEPQRDTRAIRSRFCQRGYACLCALDARCIGREIEER